MEDRRAYEEEYLGNSPLGRPMKLGTTSESRVKVSGEGAIEVNDA